jgi:hypothetical protein
LVLSDRESGKKCFSRAGYVTLQFHRLSPDQNATHPPPFPVESPNFEYQKLKNLACCQPSLSLMKGFDALLKRVLI